MRISRLKDIRLIDSTGSPTILLIIHIGISIIFNENYTAITDEIDICKVSNKYFRE